MILISLFILSHLILSYHPLILNFLHYEDECSMLHSNFLIVFRYIFHPIDFFQLHKTTQELSIILQLYQYFFTFFRQSMSKSKTKSLYILRFSFLLRLRTSCMDFDLLEVLLFSLLYIIFTSFCMRWRDRRSLPGQQLGRMLSGIQYTILASIVGITWTILG